jgi:hypothetical protein
MRGFIRWSAAAWATGNSICPQFGSSTSCGEGQP